MSQPRLPLATAFGQVRPARRSDAEELLEMIAALSRHHDDTSTTTIAHLERDLFGPTPWSWGLVAEATTPSGPDSPVICGYATLTGVSFLHYSERGLDLNHLFTKPAWRGQGVGRALVSACHILAHDLSCAFLRVSTHPDNLQAQQFYADLGFERRESKGPRFLMNYEDDPA